MIDRTRVRWVFFDVGWTLYDESATRDECFEQIVSVIRPRDGATTIADLHAAYDQAHRDRFASPFFGMCQALGLDRDRVLERAPWRSELDRPFPRAGDALRKLARRFKIGIIANQLAGTMDRLGRHGWNEWISLCVSSTEEGLRKPDPAIFRLALARGGCAAAEAVMVGDRLDNDIRPAKAVGMQTIRVLQGPVRGVEPLDEAETPDATVESIGHVRKVLVERP
jgi:FMN phosphatase YigB (HAD superfamily)